MILEYELSRIGDKIINIWKIESRSMYDYKIVTRVSHLWSTEIVEGLKQVIYIQSEAEARW